jgi:hypothetical protein
MSRKTWTPTELIAFEDRIGELYFENKLPFLFHLSGGNEQQLIDIFKDVKEGDYVISNHRCHYHALLHGIPPDELEAKILDGRSMFIYDRKRNFFCSAIIGGTPAIAAGIAWALKEKGSPNKVWCFVGDGTEDNGHLFEAARYVEGFDLPCTFVIEANNRSVSTSNEERWGKAAHINWPFKCVHKYSYVITHLHARMPGPIDLSEASKVLKEDWEYFPHVESDYNRAPYSINLNKDMTIKQAVNKAMEDLAADSNTIFLGYNVVHGNAAGSLVNVADDQKLETPVAENLMVGLAIGMSFEGFKPVVYFERFDFTLVAADALINHMDKIERLSLGEFKVPVIVRVVEADGGPFYSGPTHSQDFAAMFRHALKCPVISCITAGFTLAAYAAVRRSGQPAILIEKKSTYDTTGHRQDYS